jgi:REP-associated tyrosine transposase
MKDEDVLHPGHRSFRLRDHDYSSPGFYFVTICAHQRLCFFGRVISARMELNQLGQIALQSWMGIPEHFAHVNLHAFVTMPNHVHGIIEIGCQAGAQRAAPLQEVRSGEVCRHGVTPGSLSSIIRSFKAAVTARARKELDWKGDVWQRNYFERTLRDGQEFSDASRYISENPMKWEQDRENPKTKQAVESGVNGARRAAPLPGKI